MADYRTKPDTELTYYTFSQPNGRFTIDRFDTLDEAIAKYNEDFNIPSKFSGIGISKNKYKEIVIIHKNGDTSVLVTDYTRLSSMKGDREIKAVVQEAAKKLDIGWEYSNNIFNNSAFTSVCIPCLISGRYSLLHNENVEMLSLSPEILDNTVSAIEKIYTNGQWLPTIDVMKLCREGNHPKIESLSVKTEDIITKEQGTISVAPHDYLQMADNYVLLHQKAFPEYITAQAVDKLAGELNDFIYDYDSYEYMDQLPAGGEEEVIESISNDLKDGNIQPYIEHLNSIISGGDTTPDVLFTSNELLNRLIKIVPDKDRKPVLDRQIETPDRSNTSNSRSKTIKDDRDI